MAFWPQVGSQWGLLGIGTRTRAGLVEWHKTEQRLSEHDQTGTKQSLRGRFDNRERRHTTGWWRKVRCERETGCPQSVSTSRCLSRFGAAGQDVHRDVSQTGQEAGLGR